MTNWLNKSLNAIERVGNRLPDPATLFVMMIVLVVVVAWAAAAAGVSVVHPGTGEAVAVVSLLDPALIRKLLSEMPQTFADFPPLGTVLVVMLGIGVADKSGLIASALKQFMARVPRGLLSMALVFAGVMSSLAADAGYVVLIPLGGVLFHAAGRHPMAGIAATFAGVSAGFSANLLLTALDPVLAGLTESAAQILEPDYRLPITANYYLMIALVPLFSLGGAVLTDRVIEPRLGSWGAAADSPIAEPLTRAERRGVIGAGITAGVFIIAVAVLVIPEAGVLRGDDGGLAPFYHGLVALMFLLFLLCGLTYGLLAGTIRSDRDAVTMSAGSMADMGYYIVLAFLAAHFIALFKWSNLGLAIAIGGAGALKAAGLDGIGLLVGFILVSGIINLFIGSASAKWALLAPVFVPMLMLLDYPPELTQAAYRIGDSATNILTPLMPYFPLVIVFARKYMPSLGIGTLVATMLPYSVVFGGIGMVMLLAWVLFDIPLGPGL